MEPIKTSMSHMEQDAFENVSNACRDDVDRLCTADSYSMFPFGPSRSMPMMQDHVSSILDEVMRSLMVPEEHPMGMEPPVQRETREEEDDGPIVIHFISSSGMPPCPHMFMQHVLTQFMPMITTEEESNTLAEHIAEHGQNLVESETLPEEHVHLARRLSEVTPEQVIAHRRAFLPFAGEQNDCLLWNAQQHPSSQVSPMCLSALNGLHQVRSYQFQKALNQQHEDANIYANLFLMYAFVTATAMVLFFRRKTRTVKPGQILKAIYARPHLKLAVEKEMGHSLGSAPPTLKGLRNTICTVRWGMVLIICLVAFDVLSVANAMSGGCILAAYLFFRALLWTPEDDEACSCCCCGATPQEAADGTLTDEQACCACCQGTGVCAPDCCSCCDQGCCEGGCCGSEKEEPCCEENGEYVLLKDDVKEKIGCCGCACCANGCCGGTGGCCCCSDGCCDTKKKCTKVSTPVKCCGCACCANGCCGGAGGCCCCSPSAPKEKTVKQSRLEIYEGVPVQIV